MRSTDDAHTGSNSMGFSHKFGNWWNTNCFKLCRLTIGSPGHSLHPITVLLAITSSPNYKSCANFIANVGAMCMADKFLYLVTSASGTNLLVFIVKIGKRWSVLATSASCVVTVNEYVAAASRCVAASFSWVQRLQGCSGLYACVG